MFKVCSIHSIVQYVDYMRGAHQRGGPGAVAPFAPYKIHHCSYTTDKTEKVETVALSAVVLLPQ